MKQVIIVELSARTGCESELTSLLQAFVAMGRVEAGALTYDLYVDPQVPTEFLIYEVWESEQALRKHEQGVADRPGFDRLESLLAKPEAIRRYLFAGA